MAKNLGQNKADTAVKLVLMFFISLLSFSVGTYVGKQFSDSEARRVALEVDYSGHGQNDLADQEDPTMSEEEMSATSPVADTEVESLTEEFAKNERMVANENSAVATETTTAKTEHKEAELEGYTHHSKIRATEKEYSDASVREAINNSVHATTNTETAPSIKSKTAYKPTTTNTQETVTPHAQVTKAAERVANDQAPTADAKKLREPTNILPSVATSAIGKFTVQVASYGSENEAKDHAAKLTAKGFSAFFVPADVNGKTWYRVSVGLFSDQKSAASFRTELLGSQAVSTAIVQKIVK